MSRKQSSTSPPPDDLPVIYLDENIEPETAVELREFASHWIVKVHREEHPHDPTGKDESISDVEVIKECGENGWILISADDKMRLAPENQEAAKTYGAKVFLFPHKHLKGSQYKAAIIAGHESIVAFAKKNAPPFFARITMKGDVYHLDKDRHRPASSRDKTKSKYGDDVFGEETETVAAAKNS